MGTLCARGGSECATSGCFRCLIRHCKCRMRHSKCVANRSCDMRGVSRLAHATQDTYRSASLRHTYGVAACLGYVVGGKHLSYGLGCLLQLPICNCTHLTSHLRSFDCRSTQEKSSRQAAARSGRSRSTKAELCVNGSRPRMQPKGVRPPQVGSQVTRRLAPGFSTERERNPQKHSYPAAAIYRRGHTR